VVGDSASCPGCQTISFRVHDRYVRRPADLPWRGHPVRLRVTVRRFRCDHPTCSRSSFAEECGQSLLRYARRTLEVSQHLRVLVQVAGGEAGAKLAAADGVPTSPDTLLRLQRTAVPPPATTPRVLGVDDLALRRGQTYVTILVDLETHRPIDLIEGRDAETLASWLAAHPGVQVISRDRALDYAEGARVGAPSAVQVADRFHLAQNASNALDSMIRGRSLTVEESEIPEEPVVSEPHGTPDSTESRAEETPSDASSVQPLPVPDKPLSPTKQYLAERKATRTARWEQVRTLAQAKVSISEIARQVGISRKTVRRLIRTPEPPRNRVGNHRPGGLKSPTLQPYVTYLQDRWQAGCTNVSQLHREIVERGYPGSLSLLRQALYAWRPRRLPRKQRRRAERLTRRSTLRWLCLRPSEQLKPDERDVLDRLLAKDSDLAVGYRLLQGFRDVVASRDIAKLDAWLKDAKDSNLPTFVALANGIDADRAAVNQALILPWSNGPVEGLITKVKLIKRQGYGRAKFDLLRIRVLAA
jgi:transposase